MITFEGRISFNGEWVVSKSLEEFMEHEKHHGLSKDQLKEIYNLCTLSQKKEKPAVKV